ncbi:S9 family peptidase [Sphingobacterium rhinopitheci]|uniref:S9 family peptidase n=1 Tax=Sphingobacterium rhinopitheci TaxID=2781960 RepID=UPI001F525016|nr:prolyl oligopeptidase family serine peptidase [Sphingobacterium rhinopitheci]MCI0920954.1 S9 family peptidase [Sphingobacterium rhinopitheci]
MKKLSFLLLVLTATNSLAQENLTFQKPVAEILTLADYARPPMINMSPDKAWVLMSYRPTYKTLEELGQEEIKLAGLRINAKTRISSTENYFNNLRLKSARTAEEFDIVGLPANALISNVSFSADGQKIAFTHTNDAGVALWLIDVATKKAKQLTEYDLNAVLNNPYQWLRNSEGFLISKSPANRSALVDHSKDIPAGPVVSTSLGKVSQLRTYQDLLKNPQDEQDFESLATAALFWIDLNGKQTKFLDAAMYTQANLSPDGKYALVSKLKKPFSYVVSYNSFPQETDLYDVSGQLIAKVNETPLMEVMPKGFSSTRPGRRMLTWRADKPSTLFFVQALDGGDANKTVDFRDELFTLEYPFTGEPTSLTKVKDRFAGIIWGNDSYALVSSSWYDTRNTKTFLLNPSSGKSQLLIDRNNQDIYSDPGKPHREKNDLGMYTMYINKDKSYFVGPGFTKDGEFPFIDELDLKTLKKKRIYTAKPSDLQERITEIIDVPKGEILVSLQSASQYPNYYAKNIKTGKQKAITTIENPFKPLEAVHKEVLNYKRNDGVDLSGTLYLPAGYDKEKDGKLPLLIWAYPREYKDKSTAGQSTANPKEFTFPSYGSFIYWVNRGYAVLDNAAFPIVGEGDQEPNDTFIPQLVANAEAAINAVDALGVIDRKKVAVGGHSYGAFMTAHLLSNSDLFAAGIARSGAYNRTLTPFGFQTEQRNFWDDPELYITMSPFMSANKMKTPMLLVHGAADNNPGTFTLQTERYFQALKNLGAPVRMVILPRESHGYAAKENIFHLLWEQDQFLEKYLKNK